MEEKKHTGESVAGVTVQVRFVPLKADKDVPEHEIKKATISVRVDDTLKGTPDNLRELELPMISKLELEGETFVLNKIKLVNTIFHPKGWTKADSLTKRLEKYAMFMEDRAKSDFMICQRKARAEFIEFYKFQQKETEFANLLRTQGEEFLTWLKDAKTLFKLEYVESINADQEDLDEAYEMAVADYEKAILYFCGQKLWKNHRSTFREHLRYYQNTITKPFNMPIVDFNDRMREYGDILRHLQPPAKKGNKKSADANWDALTSITEEDVRTATFDALPEPYKTHIEGNYESDFRDMDEIDFLEAMISFETLDQARLSKLKKEKEQKKKTAAASKKQAGKRKTEDNDEPRKSHKRAYGKASYRKQKKYCSHCKEHGGKYWTHDTEECFLKNKGKESNAIEDMQKDISEMRNLIKGLKDQKKKAVHSDSDSD